MKGRCKLNLQRPDYTSDPCFILFLLCVIRGFLLRQIGFLFRGEVTNDRFALRADANFQIDRDLSMKPDRNRVFTKTLQRFAHMNTMTIDLVTAFFQRVRNVHRRH
jgi:hypothetical protein